MGGITGAYWGGADPGGSSLAAQSASDFQRISGGLAAQGAAAQAQANDRIAWERQQQQFQNNMIAQEQSRRNAESQAAMQNARYDLEQKHGKDKFGFQRAAEINALTAPMMAAVNAIGNIGGGGGGGGGNHKVDMFGSDGQKIGGSWLRTGLLR